MIEELNNYDWKEAFGFAGETETCQTVQEFIGSIPTKTYNNQLFCREDVEELYGISEGENDGQPWMCYGLLKDGRYFYLEAWCDYTGWDCQAGGSVTIADSKEECEVYALTEIARKRMGVNNA